ncbi:MAG: VWA domain-containing protein [Verrucomicrobiota bacterium]|nr:VWA domain-containing protein [Verrucomicrobiota bacterium]MEE2943159.1 VWA domain-containing protein [Verrucomicrobiota bacterium]
MILSSFWLAPFGQAQVEVTDNVVVVVDASGSMSTIMSGTGRDRMSVAKDALKQVLKQVPDTTHVGVLVFPRANWVYPLGPRKESMLARSIDSIQQGGGTPLGEYMKLGADALLQARQKQFGYGTYRLLIVTDGEAGDRQKVEDYTPDIISRGITIDVIGVEMGSSHMLAEKAHSYRNANNPQSLQQAISNVFAEVASNDGGTAVEDAFELIADLPDATASAMVKSLSTSGNQPIGEIPSMRAVESPEPTPVTYGGGSAGPKNDPETTIFMMLCVLGIPALLIYALVKAKKK